MMKSLHYSVKEEVLKSKFDQKEKNTSDDWWDLLLNFITGKIHNQAKTKDY